MRYFANKYLHDDYMLFYSENNKFYHIFLSTQGMTYQDLSIISNLLGGRKVGLELFYGK